jgi:hypothetical protein
VAERGFELAGEVVAFAAQGGILAGQFAGPAGAPVLVRDRNGLPALCPCSAGRRVAGRGIAGCLADTAADGARGRFDGDDAVDQHGPGQPASGDVRVVSADGGTAVGAYGDGIDVIAERCAVEAVHDTGSSAG